jgi:hypothetical protein
LRGSPNSTEDRLRLLATAKQSKQASKEDLKRQEEEEEKRKHLLAAQLAEWEATVRAVLEPAEETEEEAEEDIEVRIQDIVENKAQIVNFALLDLDDDVVSAILKVSCGSFGLL